MTLTALRTLTIGDWSDDGHGKTHTAILEVSHTRATTVNQLNKCLSSAFEAGLAKLPGWMHPSKMFQEYEDGSLWTRYWVEHNPKYIQEKQEADREILETRLTNEFMQSDELQGDLDLMRAFLTEALDFGYDFVEGRPVTPGHDTDRAREVIARMDHTTLDFSPEQLVDYIVWIINTGDAFIKVEVKEVPGLRLVSFGYGLF